MKFCDYIRQQVTGTGGINAKIDVANLAAVNFPDFFVQIVLQKTDFLQGKEECLPGWRQGKAGRALKKFGIQPLFQIFNVFAETLLGDKGPFGGFGKIHFFHCQEKHFMGGKL